MPEPVISGARAEELYELRRAVLRNGDEAATVANPRDDEPETVHLAAREGGVVVACASFYLGPFPYGASPPDAYQLRYMAVAVDHQGEGLGARVLREGEDLLRARGASLLWAYARDTALGFYRSLEYSLVAGSEFSSEETGLPHTAIVKELTRPTAIAPAR